MPKVRLTANYASIARKNVLCNPNLAEIITGDNCILERGGFSYSIAIFIVVSARNVICHIDFNQGNFF